MYPLAACVCVGSVPDDPVVLLVAGPEPVFRIPANGALDVLDPPAAGASATAPGNNRLPFALMASVADGPVGIVG